MLLPRMCRRRQGAICRVPRAGFGAGPGGVEGKQAGEHFVVDSGAVHGGVQRGAVLVVRPSGGFEGGIGNKLEVRRAARAPPAARMLCWQEMFETLFPRRAANEYHGAPLAGWALAAMTLLTLGRSAGARRAAGWRSAVDRHHPGG